MSKGQSDYSPTKLQALLGIELIDKEVYRDDQSSKFNSQQWQNREIN